MLTFDIAFFDIQILVNPPRGNGDFMFIVVLDMMNKMYQPHASLVKYKNTKIQKYTMQKYKQNTRINKDEVCGIRYDAQNVAATCLPHKRLASAFSKLNLSHFCDKTPFFSIKSRISMQEEESFLSCLLRREKYKRASVRLSVFEMGTKTKV